MVRAILFVLIAANLLAKEESFDIEVLSWTPRIVLLHNFLTNKECDHLQKQAKPHLARSEVLDEQSGGGRINEVRTSQGMFFEGRGVDPIISQIEERISHLTMMPVEHGESIQVLQYQPGAEFRPHHDYFDADTVGGQMALENGGQRMATVIMYLNNTEAGGETIFPEADLKVQPKKGNAVLFYNCRPDGTEDPLTLHGGAPVIKGTKWIATKWVHLNEVKN